MTVTPELVKFADVAEEKGRVIALGFFDGVHLGHREIIRKTVESAREKGLAASVLTFKNFKLKDPTELRSYEEKLQIFKELGVHQVISLDFDTIKDMEAEVFVDEVLYKKLNAKVLVSGTDYTFGKNAVGNADLLKSLSLQRGIGTLIVPDVFFENEKCSSTLIRNLLSDGDVDRANVLLGGDRFSYEGTVVRGKMLGSTLGFPTANLPIPSDRFKPKFGVYITLTTLDGVKYRSISNLGLRPTVEDSDNVNIETFIYGHEGELYGRNIKVELLGFVRPEMKFRSVDELKARVESDKEKVAILWEKGKILN
ncbi:MAG: bifunctional riboflavin kinase/FAD synthetase [Clostridiales bacterium]|nr:bifunctional riboflavin kinase/FAD synthetase [Clostridiales bacterium]